MKATHSRLACTENSEGPQGIRNSTKTATPQGPTLSTQDNRCTDGFNIALHRSGSSSENTFEKNHAKCTDPCSQQFNSIPPNQCQILLYIRVVAGFAPAVIDRMLNSPREQPRQIFGARPSRGPTAPRPYRPPGPTKCGCARSYAGEGDGRSCAKCIPEYNKREKDFVDM